MTKQEIIDLVDKYTGICDIIFSEELADALIPRIEQEKKDTLKAFVEWLKNKEGFTMYDCNDGIIITFDELNQDLENFLKEREK